jgi:hypothetical protein
MKIIATDDLLPKERRPREQSAGDGTLRGQRRDGGNKAAWRSTKRRWTGPDGGRRQGGGGDPIFRAIDSNRNGILEKSEIQNAAKAILKCDKTTTDRSPEKNSVVPAAGAVRTSGQDGRSPGRTR